MALQHGLGVRTQALHEVCHFVQLDERFLHNLIGYVAVDVNEEYIVPNGLTRWT